MISHASNDECICGCHTPFEGAMMAHCAACCRQCPSCQKNIDVNKYSDHEQKCVLSIELDYFNQHREEWCEHHTGKIVVIHGTTVYGFYDDYENALQVGYDNCGLQSFLLKEVQLVDEIFFLSYQTIISPSTSCPTIINEILPYEAPDSSSNEPKDNKPWKHYQTKEQTIDERRRDDDRLERRITKSDGNGNCCNS